MTRLPKVFSMLDRAAMDIGCESRSTSEHSLSQRTTHSPRWGVYYSDGTDRSHRRRAMPIVVDATYENGVLKLDQPLPLDERARVRLTVNPVEAQATDPLENVIGIGDGPADGADRHDDHIYGERRK